MKKILSAILVLASMITHAQVITTLQHNGQTTVYYNQNGLVDACAASVDGDSIYLSGGHFNPVTINKRLNIFGTGHFPDSTAATGITNIDGSITLNSAADNSHIEGLMINGHFYLQTDSAVNNVVVSRCYITGNFYSSGSRTTPSMFVTVKECIIGGSFSVPNFLQCDISNNLIYTTIDYAWNCSIRNNIFFNAPYYGWPYYTYYNFYDCDNSLIENNIFMSSSYYFVFCDNPLVRNNIFVQSPSSVSGSGTFTANYINISAANIFVNYTQASFTYLDNYHLQSPLIYLGSDATQVGIYGGAYPFKKSSVPINPHIRSVNIPATTDVNGNLNINISVGAQQQ